MSFSGRRDIRIVSLKNKNQISINKKYLILYKWLLLYCHQLEMLTKN